MLEKLLNWFRKKVHLNEQQLPPDFHISVGEIWWCSLGENVGIEINGKGEDFLRPVLIVRVFNKHHVWVLPLSSQKSNRYSLSLKSLSPEIKVMISQIRTISTLRLFRFITTITPEDYILVNTNLIELLKYRTPTFSGEGSSRPSMGNNKISIQDQNKEDKTNE